MRVVLTHDERSFLLEVAAAGDAGLPIPQSSEGVVAMPVGLVELTYARGWRAAVTPLGAEIVAAGHAKGRKAS